MTAFIAEVTFVFPLSSQIELKIDEHTVHTLTIWLINRVRRPDTDDDKCTFQSTAQRTCLFVYVCSLCILCFVILMLHCFSSHIGSSVTLYTFITMSSFHLSVQNSFNSSKDIHLSFKIRSFFSFFLRLIKTFLCFCFTVPFGHC